MTLNLKRINLDFDEAGNVVLLQCAGIEFAAVEPAGGSGLFVVQLRDFIGNPIRLDRSDFSDVTLHRSQDGFEIEYFNCRRLRDTAVKVWAVQKETEIRWRIQVSTENPACRCEWTDFPRLRLRRSTEERFLLPFAEGTLIDHLDWREKAANFKCEYSQYPLSGCNGFYPGPAAMQFAACFQGETGLYIGCADSAHAPKTLDIQCEGDEARRLMVQNFTGGAPGPEFEIVTAAFAGNWQDAAEIYRAWMLRHDPLLPEKIGKRIPGWLKESPVVIAFPVRGHGLDSSEMAPNEYFPYRKALPFLDRLRERWNGPLLALLMHWEGTAPWAPPYIWPPYGGEEALGEFTDAMHKAGDREAVGEYLQESYDRLKAEEYLRIAEDDLNKPDRPTSRLGERDREAILRQLVRERDKYPDPLPKYFYEEALRSDYGIAVFEPFFLAEFERAPMPLNALMLALTIRQPEPVFKELYEKKLLDSFVQLSYPEKLPPLPPPLPDGSMVRILPDTDGSGYMENEYQSLPYRERLLQWRCFRGTLLGHFRERLEQLWNTDITVTSGIDLNTGAEYVEKIWRIPGAPFKEIQETKGRFYELHHKYGLAQWKARGIPHRIVVETFVTDLFGNRRANPPGASIRNPAMKFYEILENAPLSPSQAETIWLRVMELWNTPAQLERCLNRKSERGSATPGGR